MADDIIARVDELVAEERRLRSEAEGQGAAAVDQERLRALEAQLDQCWDLLRQRRAATEFGKDPDEAKARPISQVESYRQ